MKGRSKEGKMRLDWEEERRRGFEDRGLKLEELERRRRDREECTVLVRRGREIDRRKRWKRIIESNYNK